MEDKEPYFQLAPPKKEDSETGRLKDSVRPMEERIDKLTKRVCVLEQGGEEKGSSSSEDEYGKEWRWDNGAWWSKGSSSEECDGEREVQEENLEDGKTDESKNNRNSLCGLTLLVW